MTKNVRLEEWIDEPTFGYNPKKGWTPLSLAVNKSIEISALQFSVKAKKGGWCS